MTTRLTLFTATLVQDSALSVSGVDRDSSADQPFAIVGGVPTLVGRGLKGAAVAMAYRFFDPLPRAVTDTTANGALRRSAWEFADATTASPLQMRAGVGIRQQTGGRAEGVLYDREVVPAGACWELSLRVDWSHAVGDEGQECEGILGYILAEHWAKGRCWLGGGAARGLGWCHLEHLQAFRLDQEDYERWVASGRKVLPAAMDHIPTALPTRAWYFRTLDLKVTYGEYRPDPNDSPWGLDMLAVGPHASEQSRQATGDGLWAVPAWADDTQTPDVIATDRAMLMDRGRPLIPGASVRGPLRHALSRSERIAGREVKDPHCVQGDVGAADPAGNIFGTIDQSSRLLICDSRAEPGWAAAKLHMHAEDEFAAGTYGSAKRDAVRLLRGVFPLRIVAEGQTQADVDMLVASIDQQVALGELGHLPLGGHKTRGAGWGRWEAMPWAVCDVTKQRNWRRPAEVVPLPSQVSPVRHHAFAKPPVAHNTAWVLARTGALEKSELTLAAAASMARQALGAHALVAWWCEPSIDLSLTQPPATFGRQWPETETFGVDEVSFYAERAVWRAMRTAMGIRHVLIEEIPVAQEGARQIAIIHTPARLHGFTRFSAAHTGYGNLILREWRAGDEVLGFTLNKEQH